MKVSLLRLRRFLVGGLLLAGSFMLSACGNVTTGPVTATTPASAANQQQTAVRINRVTNHTADPRYHELTHYVHIKAAQALDANPQFRVLAGSRDDAILPMRTRRPVERQ